MRTVVTGSIFVLLCVAACPGCAGKPVVHGWLDSDGTIYRESEQEDFGSRTTLKVEASNSKVETLILISTREIRSVAGIDTISLYVEILMPFRHIMTYYAVSTFRSAGCL
jgi:hypothetical protein